MHWIVFDYGEVLSRRTGALPAMAERLGVPAADFERAYWAEREAYDRGCPDTAYWQAVGKQVGVEVHDALSAELTDTDVNGWLSYDQDAMALLDELHAAGVPLALLSNAPSSFGRAVEKQPWSQRFAHLLFSGDVAMAKPDQEIWAELTRRLCAQPHDCLFLDDRQVNVDGARQAGMHAELWAGSAGIRARLCELGVLREAQ